MRRFLPSALILAPLALIGCGGEAPPVVDPLPPPSVSAPGGSGDMMTPAPAPIDPAPAPGDLPPPGAPEPK